jgi:hypothetical protein
MSGISKLALVKTISVFLATSFCTISPINASEVERLAPPYAKIRGHWLRVEPVWLVHDSDNQISAQIRIRTYMNYREFDFLQCNFRLLDAHIVEVWQTRSGNLQAPVLLSEPNIFEQFTTFRFEYFSAPQKMQVKGLLGTREQSVFASLQIIDKKRYIADQIGTTTEINAEPLYYAGMSKDYARWEGLNGRGNAPSLMLESETCLKLGRSTPGDDPLSGTIRTLADRISWTIM